MPEITDAIAGALQARGWSIAVAESLTGGLLANRFALAPDASEWFRGGVVAYGREVKHALLGVPPGPVVSETSAEHMARGAAELLGADVCVAVTGVGGPDEQDGQRPGTVWIAVFDGDRVQTRRCLLPGGPEEVCRATCDAAVSMVAGLLGVQDDAAA